MKALHLVRRNSTSMSLAALLTLSSLTSFAQTRRTFSTDCCPSKTHCEQLSTRRTRLSDHSCPERRRH